MALSFDIPMNSNHLVKDYIIQEKIGTGSYGIVFKVLKKYDKKIYVLKQIPLFGLNQSQIEDVKKEAKILSQLNSQWVVRYYDSFEENNNLNIVMEYCDGGDLSNYLTNAMKPGKLLSEDIIWRIFIQISLGLAYIHRKKILHRDLKTLNIFLTKNLIAKIGDLGVAKVLSNRTNFAKTFVGTPYYLSPEICEEKPYNEKSDVWALGCILYEIVTFRHPFNAGNQGALILKILKGKFDPISSKYSTDLRKMIDSMLERNDFKRPSMNEIIKMPVFFSKAKSLGLGDNVVSFFNEINFNMQMKVVGGIKENEQQYSSNCNGKAMRSHTSNGTKQKSNITPIQNPNFPSKDILKKDCNINKKKKLNVQGNNAIFKKNPIKLIQKENNLGNCEKKILQNICKNTDADIKTAKNRNIKINEKQISQVNNINGNKIPSTPSERISQLHQKKRNAVSENKQEKEKEKEKVIEEIEECHEDYKLKIKYMKKNIDYERYLDKPNIRAIEVAPMVLPKEKKECSGSCINDASNIQKNRRQNTANYDYEHINLLQHEQLGSAKHFEEEKKIPVDIYNMVKNLDKKSQAQNNKITICDIISDAKDDYWGKVKERKPSSVNQNGKTKTPEIKLSNCRITDQAAKNTMNEVQSSSSYSNKLEEMSEPVPLLISPNEGIMDFHLFEDQPQARKVQTDTSGEEEYTTENTNLNEIAKSADQSDEESSEGGIEQVHVIKDRELGLKRNSTNPKGVLISARIENNNLLELKEKFEKKIEYYKNESIQCIGEKEFYKIFQYYQEIERNAGDIDKIAQQIEISVRSAFPEKYFQFTECFYNLIYYEIQYGNVKKELEARNV